MASAAWVIVLLALAKYSCALECYDGSMVARNCSDSTASTCQKSIIEIGSCEQVTSRGCQPTAEINKEYHGVNLRHSKLMIMNSCMRTGVKW